MGLLPPLFREPFFTQAHNILIAILKSKELWIPKLLFHNSFGGKTFSWKKPISWKKTFSKLIFITFTYPTLWEYLYILLQQYQCACLGSIVQIGWGVVLIHIPTHIVFQNLKNLEFWNKCSPKNVGQRAVHLYQAYERPYSQTPCPVSVYPFTWIMLKRCKSKQSQDFT